MERHTVTAPVGAIEQPITQQDGQLSIQLDDFCTTETLAAQYPDLFTKSQLDWLLKNRRGNGLGDLGAIIKCSGRLYLDKKKFTTWFLHQKTQ